jgi:hypothetical protein
MREDSWRTIVWPSTLSDLKDTENRIVSRINFRTSSETVFHVGIENLETFSRDLANRSGIQVLLSNQGVLTFMMIGAIVLKREIGTEKTAGEV